jgi:hypothetical protein
MPEQADSLMRGKLLHVTALAASMMIPIKIHRFGGGCDCS